MEEKIRKLKEKLAEIADLSYANAVLEWDQQVNMPPGGAEDRGNQAATLQKLIHEKIVSDELGKLLQALEGEAKYWDADSDDSRLVKVAKREYDKQTKVSSEWVGKFAKATALAQSAWEKAKPKSDFASFLPYLIELVDLRREYAEFFKPYDHVYDPLLDDFEPGMKTFEVQEIFNELRPKQVEMIKAISEKPEVDNSFLYYEYPQEGQLAFGKSIINEYGYDWERGRQDLSAHPFTTSFGLNDVRITTRVKPKFLNTALFGTLHECGHALYEQGVNQDYSRTPLANGASMAVHESQSRMFENLIGRSYPFWKHYYPRLQEFFPKQLGDVDLEVFYKGINKVIPSLIRVEADEATYNLHIMLRLEIEIALMEGSIDPKDLPEMWNSKMKEYLGIVPPKNEDGVLQDVHWSAGLFGYFPTYALGNLVSAQLWEAMLKDNPDADEQIGKGKFDQILGWMREHVHHYGAKYEPQELVERITGEKINAAPYLRYLEKKFRAIYEI